MKKGIVLLSFLLMIITSNSSTAKDLSFGIGMGGLYSGLGLNLNSTTISDMKYVSVGCAARDIKIDYGCGVGLGWVTTSIFGNESNKHGLGFYLGNVNIEKTFVNGNHERDTLYGGGLGYHYFTNGIDKPGWSFGLSSVYGKRDVKDFKLLWLQAGYQF